MAQRSSPGNETLCMRPKLATESCAPETQTQKRKPQRHRQHDSRGQRSDIHEQTTDAKPLNDLMGPQPAHLSSTAQTQSDMSKNFDPQAQPFQPSSTRRKNHYTPYEPLRISNGSTERRMVYSVNKPDLVQQNLQSSASTARESPRRNPARLCRTTGYESLATEILPSIEPHRPLTTGQTSSYTPPWRRNLHQKSYSQSRSPTVEPPTRPIPTTAYISQAEKACEVVAEPRKLLVVLDLNGTLLYRANKKNPQSCKTRPGVIPLLKYLFEHHTVMVYTSARAMNVQPMVETFMHPAYRNKLAAIWTREDLDLTQEQYQGKVQVYKKLEKIWADRGIQSTAPDGVPWDQTNTILIDDSIEKAAAQPYNLVLVPEYTKQDNPESQLQTGNHKHTKIHTEAVAQAIKVQSDILKQLELKLEALKYQADVSRLVRLWQLGEAAVPCAPGQTISIEENVQGKSELVQSAKVRDLAASGSKMGQSGASYPQRLARRYASQSRNDVDVAATNDAGGQKAAPNTPSDRSDGEGCVIPSASTS